MSEVELHGFVVGERLGEGGHATVYRARHRPTGRDVALKVWHQGDEGALRTLASEVEAVAGMSHPHIVAVYDVGTIPAAHPRLPSGAPWVALELASHGALAQRPPRRWVTLQLALLQVLRALGHAHAHGVVHRDLKPANVLRSGRALKVADFGLAWALGRSPTSASKVAGTPEYMAPEQVHGELDLIGPWTDLYALGCMAWELATGKPPLVGDSVLETMQRQVSQEPGPFLPAIDLPAGFEAWVRGLLAKDRLERGDSAALVAADLQALGTEVTEGLGGPLSTDEVDRRTWSASLEWDGPLLEAEPVVGEGATRRWLPPRERWQEGERPWRAPWLVGSGLGVFALRSAPLVGRFAERDRLWELTRQVAEEEAHAAVTLAGEPGVGCSSLGRWLARELATWGYGAVVDGDHPAVRQACSGDLTGLWQLAERGLTMVWLDSPDDEGLALLERVVAEAPYHRAPLLVVACTEASITGAERIDVGPLPDAQMEHLLSHGLGLAPGLRTALARRAAGLPADAMRLLRELVEADALVEGPDGFEAPGGIDHLSATRAEAAAARVRALLPVDPDEWGPVQLAALLGPRASHGAWRDACAHAGLDADPAHFESLLSAGEVRWDGGWRFRAGVVVDAVLAPLQGEQEHQLAGAAADALSSGVRRVMHQRRLAELLLRAARPHEALEASQAVLWTNRRAREFLAVARVALDQAEVPPGDWRRVGVELTALRSHGHDGADTLDRSLRWLDELSAEVRGEVVDIVAAHAFDAGRLDVSAKLWEEAVAFRRDGRRLRNLGTLLWHLGDNERSEALCREAAERIQHEPESDERLRVINDLADWDRVHGRLDEAEAGFREVIRSCQRLGLTFDIVPRLNLVDVLRRRGQVDEALEEARALQARVDRRSSRRLAGAVAVAVAVSAVEARRVDVLAHALARLEVVSPAEISAGGPESAAQLLLAAERCDDPHHAERLRGLFASLTDDLQMRGRQMLPTERAAVPWSPPVG